MELLWVLCFLLFLRALEWDIVWLSNKNARIVQWIRGKKKTVCGVGARKWFSGAFCWDSGANKTHFWQPGCPFFWASFSHWVYGVQKGIALIKHIKHQHGIRNFNQFAYSLHIRNLPSVIRNSIKAGDSKMKFFGMSTLGIAENYVVASNWITF